MKIGAQTMQEWESWEHLILSDLKAIDRKVQLFYRGSSHDSETKKAVKEKFVAARLQALILQSVGGVASEKAI